MTRRFVPTIPGAPGRVVPVPSILRVGARPLVLPVRSSAMLLLNEELARSRTREREAEAAQVRLAVRLQAADKWRRRAERADQRARLAAAAVV